MLIQSPVLVPVLIQILSGLIPLFIGYFTVFPEKLDQDLIIFLKKKNGDMVWLVSKGPDSFWSVWTVFVSHQKKTRYCGHTLSRLMDFWHNMTKQRRFPNIWRESPKSWNFWNTNSVILA